MMWLQNNLEKKNQQCNFQCQHHVEKIDHQLKGWKKSFGKITYINTQGCTHEEIKISWNWI